MGVSSQNLSCDFILQLKYKRGFSADAIISRSIREINQQHKLTDYQKQKYQSYQLYFFLI